MGADSAASNPRQEGGKSLGRPSGACWANSRPFPRLPLRSAQGLPWAIIDRSLRERGVAALAADAPGHRDHCRSLCKARRRDRVEDRNRVPHGQRH